MLVFFSVKPTFLLFVVESDDGTQPRKTAKGLRRVNVISITSARQRCRNVLPGP
jgi:hypothetical protein